MQDFYEVLDVDPDASRRRIRRAYREKVKEYHPDVNDDSRARAQFTTLKRAEEVLTDGTERRAYDRLGHERYVAERLNGGLVGSGRSPRTSAAAGGTATTRNRTRGRTSAQQGSQWPGGDVPRGGRVDDRRRAGANPTAGSDDWRSVRETYSGYSATEYTVRYLWLFVLVASLPYVGGLAAFSLAHGGTILAALVADPAALATDRSGLPTLTSAIVASVEGDPGVGVAGVLLLVGAVVLPVAFAMTVWQLRRLTVWRASPLYVVAAAGPVGGIALNLAGVTTLPVDAVCYLLLPLAAISTLLYHRFR
ncbi:DnaJ domain-containing protein [Natronorarus salvus]|uniref:DnaJ domain-containing protein n=1 Tax=Natronorarus salvus TaxID=3117733 RepID=UPI002F2625DA